MIISLDSNDTIKPTSALSQQQGSNVTVGAGGVSPSVLACGSSGLANNNNYYNHNVSSAHSEVTNVVVDAGSPVLAYETSHNTVNNNNSFSRIVKG